VKTIETTIEISASPKEIWEVLIDFPSHQEWNPFFARIEGQAVEGQQLRVVARNGDSDGMKFAPVVLELVPNRKLRWKGKLWLNGIFDGEHIFELTDRGDGTTRLDHRENFSGILIPLMGKVLAETRDGFVAFNEALASEVSARREANCRP